MRTSSACRYTFKGAASAVTMVEVVATHLTPRRQQLQDPALLPKGPKGGLAEPQQGLVGRVQGVQLPGLANLYRQRYQERQAAAAVATAAAAAMAAERSKAAVFGVHRFLRNSLPLQQEQQTAGKGSGRVSSSGSLGGSSQAAGSVTARLGSIFGRSFSVKRGRSAGSAGSAAGQRLSVASAGLPESQGSRLASVDGVDVAAAP
jgi:hypothetical protein